MNFIPKPIVPDLMINTFVFNKITYSKDTEREYYYKLLMMIPKIILSKPKRNNSDDLSYNTKINLYKRRIRYFRNGDDDGILRSIAAIQAQQMEYNKKKNKEKNNNKYNKKRINRNKEKRKIKTIEKYMKMGSMSKAWKAADDVEIIKMTPINYKLWKSKFIQNDKDYEKCKIEKLEYKINARQYISEQILDKLINKIDAGTTAGVDGLSGCHIKYLWKNADQQFKLSLYSFISGM